MAERFRVLLLVGICCMDAGYDPQYRFFKLSAGNTDNIPGIQGMGRDPDMDLWCYAGFETVLVWAAK